MRFFTTSHKYLYRCNKSITKRLAVKFKTLYPVAKAFISEIERERLCFTFLLIFRSIHFYSIHRPPYIGDYVAVQIIIT